MSLGAKFQELAAMAVRRELTLINLAAFPVLLSFVAMYAALGPILQTQFGLDDTSVLYVRLAGLPAILLAPLAGWLVGRWGRTRVAVVRLPARGGGACSGGHLDGRAVAARDRQRGIRPRYRHDRALSDRDGRQPRRHNLGPAHSPSTACMCSQEPRVVRW